MSRAKLKEQHKNEHFYSSKYRLLQIALMLYTRDVKFLLATYTVHICVWLTLQEKKDSISSEKLFLNLRKC